MPIFRPELQEIQPLNGDNIRILGQNYGVGYSENYGASYGNIEYSDSYGSLYG